MFGLSALAVVLLTVVGLWGLSRVDTNFTPPWVSLFGGTNAKPVIPGDSALPPADTEINPELPITIINGTPTAGLANQVGDLLVGKGWDGASVEVGARVNAEERTVTKTVVYYDAPENEAAAHGLIASLGVGVAHFSSDYPASPLALVLGADYVPTEPPSESDPDVAGE